MEEPSPGARSTGTTPPGSGIAIVKKNASGARTEMIWFIGDTQAHYSGAGAITHIYSHLSMGTPVARVDRTADTTTTLEFQFHGLASNTIAAVAQNGTINASFSYAPFGEVLEATNAGAATPPPPGQGTAVHKRRFNDKFEDDIGGLTYYGARFYDKTLIGWTQSDPLYRFAPDRAWTEPRRANFYSFSLQNALRYVDPDGLDGERPEDASKETPCTQPDGGCFDTSNVVEASPPDAAAIEFIRTSLGETAAADAAQREANRYHRDGNPSAQEARPYVEKQYEKSQALGIAVGMVLPGPKGSGAAKAATSTVTKGAAKAAREGIYEFAENGATYVGQSGSTASRIKQHVSNGRTTGAGVTFTPVPGGKVAREVAEHTRIQQITGGVPASKSSAVTNKVDPIGPKRQHLLP